MIARLSRSGQNALHSTVAAEKMARQGLQTTFSGPVVPNRANWQLELSCELEFGCLGRKNGASLPIILNGRPGPVAVCTCCTTDELISASPTSAYELGLPTTS